MKDACDLKELINILQYFISLGFGVFGYFAANFWMKPILQFQDLRATIASDLVFHRNVLMPEPGKAEASQQWHDKLQAHRRASSDLAACFERMPRWYRRWLQIRGFAPEKAVRSLIGLSNAADYEGAARCRRDVVKHLKLGINDLV